MQINTRFYQPGTFTHRGWSFAQRTVTINVKLKSFIKFESQLDTGCERWANLEISELGFFCEDAAGTTWPVLGISMQSIRGPH